VRPEHLRVGAATGDASALRGEVVLVENLGESALVYVRVPGAAELALVRVDGTSYAKEGETIELAVPAAATYLFDAADKACRRGEVAQPGAGDRQAS
jgi:multiple sugar transport system ATP-binding protein